MILEVLKKETAQLHQEVEQDNLAQYIMDGSISIEQYDTLLRQNFMIYKGVEDFINSRYEKLPEEFKIFAGFDKTNRLAKDIMAISRLPLPTALRVIGPRNLASIIGNLYVVEGSMVGGMMMAKKIEDCPHLAHIDIHHFYSKKTAGSISRWKGFKEAVSNLSFTELEAKTIVSSAKDTFKLFQKAYLTTPIF